MLVKIFGTGKGQGEGVVGYLLGYDYLNGGEMRAGASILNGDPRLTQELINANGYAKRYTAGCLSFEESPDSLTAEQKRDIMQSFEDTIFTGLDSDQYNILWVEHTDKINPTTGKPRLELNFVIPNIECRTGKRLQPYYHSADVKRVNAFQNLVNFSYSLSDPHDPNKQREVNPYASRNLAKTADLVHKDTPKGIEFSNHSQAKQAINNAVAEQIEQGKISNRDDIINYLPTLKLVIDRVTDNSITVKAPNITKNIRLNSNIFKKDWLANKSDLVKEYSEKPITTHIQENLEIWKTGLEIKYHDNMKRHKPNEQAPLQADLSIELKHMTALTANAPQAEPQPHLVPQQKTPLTRLVKDLFPITATFKRDFYKKDNIQTVENLITQGNDVYLNYFKDGDFRAYHRPQSTIEQNIYNQLKRHVDKQTQQLDTTAPAVQDYLTMNISEYAERHKIALNNDDMSRITKIHNDLLYKEIMQKPQVESESNKPTPEPTPLRNGL